MRLPRFHLITLIVALMLAGGLLGLHIRPIRYDSEGPRDTAKVISYGVPFAFYHEHGTRSKHGHGGGSGSMVSPLAALLNFAVVILPVVVFIERRIAFRNRSGSRPERNRRIQAGAFLAALAVAACILALNLRSGHAVSSGVGSKSRMGESEVWYSDALVESGWPIPTYRFVTGSLKGDVLEVRVDNEVVAQTSDAGPFVDSSEFTSRTMAAAQLGMWQSEHASNLVAGLFIVWGAYYLAEYLLMRWFAKWFHPQPFSFFSRRRSAGGKCD